MTSAMKEIAWAILNTNNYVQNEAKIFEAINKLGMEGANHLDVVYCLIGYPNCIRIFLHVHMSFTSNGWLERWELIS